MEEIDDSGLKMIGKVDEVFHYHACRDDGMTSEVGLEENRAVISVFLQEKRFEVED